MVVKAVIKIIGSILGVILAISIVAFLFAGLGIRNKKLAKQAAMEYIAATYPDFAVCYMDVQYQWMPNVYVITYRNAAGNERTVTFDNTGKNLVIDNYIEDKSRQVIYAYTGAIKNTLKSEISEKVVPVHFMVVDLYKNEEEKREIVLEGKSVAGDPVDCTIAFLFDGTLSKVKFAELAQQSAEIVKDCNIPTKTLRFVSQNSPESRYDLKWEDTMLEMSLAQLETFVE